MRKIVLTAIVLSLILATITTFMPESVNAMTGSGTSEDPYVIWNCTDLQNINLYLAAYYELGQDIDCSCTSEWNWNAARGVYQGFSPINSQFTGQLEGNSYAITNLYINRSYNSSDAFVGVFRHIGSIGLVQRVKVLDADITVYKSVTGDDTVHVGALAGMLYGTVYSCRTTGNISCNWTNSGAIVNGVGGLVGNTEFSAVVRYCCSYVNVDFRDLGGGAGIYAGGLVGYHSGNYIKDSYARGSVYGYSTYAVHPSVGGLMGSAHQTNTDNSYSTGWVDANNEDNLGGFVGSRYQDTITDSFWDKQTSGRTSSAGGTGKTTAEMKTESTFTNAGWNFDTIWGIAGGINDGYPYLEWWYDPYIFPGNFTQVVWFQPNAIIEGTELPNRAGASYPDGIITWGANPAGITITHGELIPEEEYDFEPIIPEGLDIIEPNPSSMTTDVDTEALHSNPLYPLVQILSIDGFLNERLVWLGLAWFLTILAMFLVHLGFDTKKGTQKPQHFVLTSITGLALSVLFYVMGIFPWWVILLMAIGLGGAIIWERQPVI